MTATGKKTGQIDHTEAPPPLAEGMMTDFITGQPVKETEKEKVRQEVVRQLIGEYQIAPENLEAGFPVKVADLYPHLFGWTPGMQKSPEVPSTTAPFSICASTEIGEIAWNN